MSRTILSCLRSVLSRVSLETRRTLCSRRASCDPSLKRHSWNETSLALFLTLILAVCTSIFGGKASYVYLLCNTYIAPKLSRRIVCSLYVSLHIKYLNWQDINNSTHLKSLNHGIYFAIKKKTLLFMHRKPDKEGHLSWPCVHQLHITQESQHRADKSACLLKWNLDFVTLKQHGEDKSSQTVIFPFSPCENNGRRTQSCKILNYIFNNCSADDNADEANIEDQTT